MLAMINASNSINDERDETYDSSYGGNAAWHSGCLADLPTRPNRGRGRIREWTLLRFRESRQISRPTSHCLLIAFRTSLPEPTWRSTYGGSLERSSVRASSR